jgi:hypothetical protein
MLLEKTIRRRCLAPTPEFTQPEFVGPPAQRLSPTMHLAPPQAAQRPRPDSWPISPDQEAFQGAGRRSLGQAAQAASRALPTSTIWQ